MSDTIKKELPSGAELLINIAPFADAKALYQALFEELKGVKLDAEMDIGPDLIKDLFCIGFSSKKVESALAACMKRSAYNGLKITDETWEPTEAREDYWQACIEVARANIAPFAKSLLREYSPILGALKYDLASRLKTQAS
jgi:hypothetical protein